MTHPPTPHPKSVRRDAQTFILVILIFTGAFLLALFHLEKRQNAAQSDFVLRSSRVGEVFQTLDNMERSLQNHMRSLQDGSLDDFRAKSRHMHSLLGIVSDLTADAQPSLNYIRRLEAFNHYQEELLANSAPGSADRLATLSYLRLALADQKTQSNELLRTDLGLSRGAYERTILTLRNREVHLWCGFICFFIIAVGLFIRSLSGFNQSLRSVHSHLHSLALKDWHAPDLDRTNYVELDGIVDTINKMQHVILGHIARIEEQSRLERQIDMEKLENEKKERMLVEAQMAHLKAQINPHFLFNTLNIIGKSALLGDPEIVMELVEATARILRYSLDTADRSVTVRDEIDMASNYLYVQKQRFGNALTYDVTVSPSVADCRIQSMLVQPLLENSFKHGFTDGGPMHIDIDAHEVESGMDIVVTDNGNGFDPSLPGTPSGEGIGIENIRRRLELEWGARASLDIEAAPGHGARVRISLPCTPTKGTGE